MGPKLIVLLPQHVPSCLTPVFVSTSLPFPWFWKTVVGSGLFVGVILGLCPLPSTGPHLVQPEMASKARVSPNLVHSLLPGAVMEYPRLGTS